MPIPIDNSPGQSSMLVQEQSRRQRVKKALAQLPVTAEGGRVPGREELIKPVQQINSVLRAYGVQFDFSDESSRVITRIVDAKSGETIRQIPAEEVVRIAERLDHLVGLLLEQRV